MNKLIGIFALALAITACKKENVDITELYGAWQSSETSKNYVFEEDMTFHFIGDSTAGNYSVSGSDLEMSYLTPGGELLFTDFWRVVQLNTSTLILGVENSKGKLVTEEEFARVE